MEIALKLLWLEEGDKTRATLERDIEVDELFLSLSQPIDPTCTQHICSRSK